MRIHHPAVILLSLSLVDGAMGQTELIVFSGSTKSSEFGGALAGVGDVNGDGIPDVAIGAPRDKTQAFQGGAVRVYSGLGGELHAIFGEVGDQLGRSVDAAGDLDGDGLADVLVGAPFARDEGVAKGAAVVHSGADGAPWMTLFGDNVADLFGQSVAQVGDVDGDGVPDIAAGAILADFGGVSAGRVRVHSGATGALLWAFDGGLGDRLGVAVAPAGDVDGDGFDDVLAGADLADPNGSSSGSAYVVSGQHGVVVLSMHGDSAGDLLGASVDGGADVDLDGVPDLLVGAPNDVVSGVSSGSARVFSGASGLVLQVMSAAGGDEFGTSVRFAGDIDRDDLVDFIVGGRMADGGGLNSGEATVFSGTGEVMLRFSGGAVADHFGHAVASAGDVDGDGFRDLLVGAPEQDMAVLDAGAATIFSGCDATALAYGSGCVGSGGAVPSLRLLGCPVPGAQVTLTSESLLGGGFGLVFFGTDEANLHLFGGCALLVTPLLPTVLPVVATGAGAGEGRVDIPAVIPADHPSATYTAQAFYLDAGSPFGISSTNGLRVEIP